MSGALAACSAAASSDDTSTQQTTPTRTARLCAGAQVAEAAVASCPIPSKVRPGRTCEGRATCPSPDLLFGECRCVDSAWSCDDDEPPKGYDPYPDCTDDGAESGGACFLEGSTCLPHTASACFTSGVALCKCDSHAWTCP